MKIRLLTRRYARAFLDNIAENEYETVHADIKVIRDFIELNPELIKILQSIITPRKMRLELLDAIMEQDQKTGLELQQQKFWKGLFQVLVAKHRIQLITEIIDEIERLLFLRQNRAKINLYLAREQSPDLIDKIMQHIGKLTGKELIPHTEIRSEIIGGFVASVDSLRIDGSVRHNLEKFKKIRKA